MATGSGTTMSGTSTASLNELTDSLLAHILHYVIDPACAPSQLAYLAPISRLFRRVQQSSGTLWQDSRLRADTPHQVAALALLLPDSLPHLQHIELLSYKYIEPLPLASIAALQRAAPNNKALKLQGYSFDAATTAVLSEWRLERVCLLHTGDSLSGLLLPMLHAWSPSLTAFEYDGSLEQHPTLVMDIHTAAPALIDLNLPAYELTNDVVIALCQLTQLRRLAVNTQCWDELDGHADGISDLLPLATACSHLESVHIGAFVTDLHWVNTMTRLTSVSLLPLYSLTWETDAWELDDTSASIAHLLPHTRLTEVRFLGNRDNPKLSASDLLQLSLLPMITTLQHARLASSLQLASQFAALRHLQRLSMYRISPEQLEHLCQHPPPNLRQLAILMIPANQNQPRWHTELMQQLAASNLVTTLEELQLISVDLTAKALKALAQFKRLQSLSVHPLIWPVTPEHSEAAWWQPLFNGIAKLEHLQRLEIAASKNVLGPRMSQRHMRRWFGQSTIQQLQYLQLHVAISAGATGALLAALGQMPNLRRLNLRLLTATKRKAEAADDARMHPDQSTLDVLHSIRQLRQQNGLAPIQVDSVHRNASF